MFTGLISETGRVARLRRTGPEGILAVACSAVLDGAQPGDSIAVDGACLTVSELSREGFTAFLSAETLDKTTLGDLRPGDEVNLEPSLRLSDRLGGHLVQGHVEGVGTVASLAPLGQGWRLAVDLPPGLEEAVIPKGSVALAGVSLTVAALSGQRLEVALIPGTLKSTTLRAWHPGRLVNVETDLVGRYVLAYLKGRGNGPGALTIEGLLEKGL